MLFFKHRKQLTEKYYDWVRLNNVKDCPFSVISFLAANDLLNEDKCMEQIRKKPKQNNIVIDEFL